MTIDEAIAMMHEWADYDCYNEEQIQASEAFNQIAVLLEELKFRRVLQLQCEKEFFAGYEKGKKEEWTDSRSISGCSSWSQAEEGLVQVQDAVLLVCPCFGLLHYIPVWPYVRPYHCFPELQA